MKFLCYELKGQKSHTLIIYRGWWNNLLNSLITIFQILMIPAFFYINHQYIKSIAFDIVIAAFSFVFIFGLIKVGKTTATK